MLSRTANAIYWTNRYIERAENVARFIDVNLQLMLDVSLKNEEQWWPLIATTGDTEPFEARYGEATRDHVMNFLTFDEENPNSIISCVRAARENARSIRDVISSDMWQQINEFYLVVTNPQAREWADETAYEFYRDIKRNSHLFAGLTDHTMTHGEGWHFARMGRMLERADKTSRTLDVKYFILLPQPDDVGSPLDHAQWSALLNSASAFEMYRKQYGRIAPYYVAEFLVLNREFPRAIHHCISHAEESIRAITGAAHGSFDNDAQKELGKLRCDLGYMVIGEIMETGLHEYLDTLQERINRVDDLVYEAFFAIAPMSKDGSDPTNPADSGVAMSQR